MIIVSLLVMATVGYSQKKLKKPEVVFDSLTYNYGVIAKVLQENVHLNLPTKAKHHLF